MNIADSYKKDPQKIRLLCWMDSPVAPTGFATVARNVLNELAKTGRYDIDVIGINDRGGWKDPEKYPYKIFPARMSTVMQGDFHGRDRLVNAVLGKDMDLVPPWDIIFTLNDPLILEQPLPVFNAGTMQVLLETREAYKKKLPPSWLFKVVSYIPIDSSIKGNWIENSIALADYPVAYTEYGKEEISEADLSLAKPTGVAKRTKVIYHGINLDDFKVLPKEEVDKFKKDYFRGVVDPHTFLVVSVARNQLRKDLPRTLCMFAEFKKRRPDSFLYIHAQETDAWGSLKEYARNFNLEFGKDWGVPQKFNAGVGFPVEALNLIYNSADCILSTSLGEGWGFYNTEAFATKTVVVAPDNTVHPEIFGYKSGDDISDMDALCETGIRGIPVKSRSNLSEWATYGIEDLERTRPLTNVEDGVKKLIWAYDNPDKVKEITERAHKWVQDYTWANIGKQWDDFLRNAYKDLQTDRSKIKYVPATSSKHTS